MRISSTIQQILKKPLTISMQAEIVNEQVLLSGNENANGTEVLRY